MYFVVDGYAMLADLGFAMVCLWFASCVGLCFACGLLLGFIVLMLL